MKMIKKISLIMISLVVLLVIIKQFRSNKLHLNVSLIIEEKLLNQYIPPDEAKKRILSHLQFADQFFSQQFGIHIDLIFTSVNKTIIKMYITII